MYIRNVIIHGSIHQGEDQFEVPNLLQGWTAEMSKHSVENFSAPGIYIANLAYFNLVQ